MAYAQTRLCAACGEVKAGSDFYASVSRCKACHRAAATRRRRTDPAVQAYDRERAKTPARKAHIKRTSTRWREDNPEAYRAQTAVGNALRDGKLKREPCLFCGATEHVHGHHRDYAKPLDVTWLCARCHHRLHAHFPHAEEARA